MTPAILYARFSPRPDAAETDSITKQLDRCRAYCIAQDYTLLAEENDAELSGGRADNRPGLQRALALACQHKAVLVCYDLSRLARNTRDAIEIVERLQAAGANLAFLDMKLDTSSPTGRCFFTILAAFAQLYREQIAVRTSAAMLKHQAAGRRMSDRAPYGWKKDPANSAFLVTDPHEQNIIEWIRDKAAQGKPQRQIARALDSQQITCRGHLWHHTQIDRILKRK